MAASRVSDRRTRSGGGPTPTKSYEPYSIASTTRPRTSAGTRLGGGGGDGIGRVGGGALEYSAWSKDLDSLQAETLDVLKRCGAPSSRAGLLQRSKTLPSRGFSSARVRTANSSSRAGRRPQTQGSARTTVGRLKFHKAKVPGNESEPSCADDEGQKDLAASTDGGDDDCDGDDVRCQGAAAVKIQRILREWLCRRRLCGDRAESCQPSIQHNSHGLDEAVRSNERMFMEDGAPNSLLRDTVSSALKTSRFDSVSTVLTRGRPDIDVCGLEEKENRSEDRAALVGGKSIFLQDEGQRMVSAVRLSKSRSGRRKRNKDRTVPSCSGSRSNLELPDSLVIRDVQYTGFDELSKRHVHPAKHSGNHGRQGDAAKEERIENKDTNNVNRRVCFNCWSAGKGKHCSVHGGADKGDSPDDSILLCKNWDRDVMRRRYRAEEIQEVFSKTESSLSFDKTQHEFCTVKEYRHPIYRMLAKRIAHVNFTRRRKDRVRSWFRSIIELLKVDEVVGYYNEASARILRLKRTLMNLREVRNLSSKVKDRHPRAPVTGTTLAERTGLETIVVERDVAASNHGLAKRKFIVAGPIPVPRALYQPRRYETPPPRAIHIAANEGYFEAPDPAATVSGAFTRAQTLIDRLQVTPGHSNASSGVDFSPKTLKFATFSRKDAPNNLAVGGLSCEVIVSQLVSNFIPPRYGNFICIDRTLVAPKRTPEVTTSFKTFRIEPVNQEYVERELEHPLNTRLPPTIMIVAGLDPDEKHYYGKNRPEQTGEEQDYGFRTSISSPLPSLNSRVDTSTFVPADEVASLNLPAVHPASTTRADASYPFRETTSRAASISDFRHLPLSMGRSSPNIPQVFTCLGFQEAGRFMKWCDPKQRLGHLGTEVTRSWSFLQNYTVEQFFTDDGVPYWYDRHTCETFWERPLYNEEKVALVEGGVYIGHVDVGGRAAASNRRCQIRNMVFERRETQDEKYCRIRSASRSVPGMKISMEGQNKCQIDPSPRDKKSKVHKKRASKSRNEQCAPDPSPEPQELLLRQHRTSSSSENEAKVTQACPSVQDGRDEDEGGPEDGGGLEDASTVSQASLVIHDNTEALVDSITKALGNAIQQASKPEDMLRLGVGLGMSLGAQGLLNASSSSLQSSSEKSSAKAEEDVTNDVGEKEKSEEVLTNAVEPPGEQRIWKEPIGLPDPSWQVENDALDDDDPEGADYAEHDLPPDGLQIWERADDIPADMLEAISSKRVGRQEEANHLATVVNLPKGNPVGRVKPRSAGEDWQAIGFDPWSAGREPLVTEFISTLTMKPKSLTTRPRSGNIDSAYIDLEDTDGLEDEARKAAIDAMLAQDFVDICRYVRHGKYREVEEMLDDPDWPMPVDYTDEAGNNLLMVCCQNGNKRIAKLCLRKGSDINKQNLNGHTCLHFAFGYGFSELGEYLCSKGADGGIKNKEGLTAYEGLSMEDVSAL